MAYSRFQNLVAGLRRRGVSRFHVNVLSNAGAAAFGSVVQAGMLVVLGRVLSVADFAAFITAGAIIAIGEVSADFGVRMLAIGEFATQANATSVLKRVSAAKLLYSVATAVIIVMAPEAGFSTGDMLVIAAIAATQSTTDPILWMLRGKELLVLDATITVVWRVGSSVAFMLLASAGYGVRPILVAWLATNVLHVLGQAGLPIVRRLLAAVGDRVTGRDVVATARLAFPIGLALLLLSTYQRLGILGLGRFGSLMDVAQFGMAFKLVASGGFLVTSVALSSFPEISLAHATGDRSSLTSAIRRNVTLISWVFVPICGLGAAITPLVAAPVFGTQYEQVGRLMVLLMPGLYVSCISYLCRDIMIAVGARWRDALTVCVGIIAFFIVLLAPSHPAIATRACLGWVVGESAAFGAKWLFLWRRHRPVASAFRTVPLWFAALVVITWVSAGGRF